MKLNENQCIAMKINATGCHPWPGGAGTRGGRLFLGGGAFPVFFAVTFSCFICFSCLFHVFPLVFRFCLSPPRGLRFTKMLILFRKTCIFCTASNARPFVFIVFSMCFMFVFISFLVFNVFGNVFGRNFGALGVFFHAWRCGFPRNMSVLAPSPPLNKTHCLWVFMLT